MPRSFSCLNFSAAHNPGTQQAVSHGGTRAHLALGNVFVRHCCSEYILSVYDLVPVLHLAKMFARICTIAHGVTLRSYILRWLCRHEDGVATMHLWISNRRAFAEYNAARLQRCFLSYVLRQRWDAAIAGSYPLEVFLAQEAGGRAWRANDVDIWVRTAEAFDAVKRAHDDMVCLPLQLQSSYREYRYYSEDDEDIAISYQHSGHDAEGEVQVHAGELPLACCSRRELLSALHIWHTLISSDGRLAQEVIDVLPGSWPAPPLYTIERTCFMTINTMATIPLCLRTINVIQVEEHDRSNPFWHRLEATNSFFPEDPIAPQVRERKQAFTEFICAGFDIRACGMYMFASDTDELRVAALGNADSDARERRIVLQQSAFMPRAGRWIPGDAVARGMGRLRKYEARGFLLGE